MASGLTESNCEHNRGCRRQRAGSDRTLRPRMRERTERGREALAKSCQCPLQEDKGEEAWALSLGSSATARFPISVRLAQPLVPVHWFRIVSFLLGQSPMPPRHA